MLFGVSKVFIFPDMANRFGDKIHFGRYLLVLKPFNHILTICYLCPLTGKPKAAINELMKKNTTIRFSAQQLLALMLAVFFSGCAIFKKQPKEESPGVSPSFYEEHSLILGFPLSGNENPELIKEVASWLGTPYRHGGSTKAGTDCSGMVRQIFLVVFKISLPRSSAAIADFSSRIRRTQLRVGDLVFFETASKRRINHVGIYLGSNKFIHSSTSRGVIVTDLDETYWIGTYARAGRVL